MCKIFTESRSYCRQWQGRPAESKRSNSMHCHMKPNNSQSGSEPTAHTWQQGSPPVSIRAVGSKENQNKKRKRKKKRLCVLLHVYSQPDLATLSDITKLKFCFLLSMSMCTYSRVGGEEVKSVSAVISVCGPKHFPNRFGIF